MDESTPKKNQQGFKRPLPFFPKDPGAKKVKVEALQHCVEVHQERQQSVPDSISQVDPVCLHPKNAIIEDHRAGYLVCSECGVVVGEWFIDVAAECRSDEEKTSDGKLLKVYKKIEEIAERIHLVRCIVNQAKDYFKKMYEGKFLKRRSHYVIAAACLFIACNKEGVSRAYEEISGAGGKRAMVFR